MYEWVPTRPNTPSTFIRPSMLLPHAVLYLAAIIPLMRRWLLGGRPSTLPNSTSTLAETPRSHPVLTVSDTDIFTFFPIIY
ncbi:hypothetical protein BKA70DRAFT_1571720 [Coprinopsis sp. MPI-PUGE-AT-0042]|nr:hypothetical protein BKA70DRAFT_1571720 [Coprinopsis sp. MPI-PUGE-AT-0042]